MIILRQIKIPAVIASIIALGYALLVLTKPISLDEGVFLSIAKYITQGDLPYRDFFDHKPPGIHLLFALLFKIFGTSIWVPKVALIFATLGSAYFVQKIGDRLKGGSGWTAASIFLFLTTQFEGYYLVAEPFMILPLLAATWLLVREKITGRSLWLAGTCLALAILFKQTAIISVLPLLWLGLWRGKLRIPMFILGFDWLLILVAAWLLLNGVFSDAWRQVVVLTLTQYPAEPFGVVVGYLQTNFLWTLPIWALAIFGLTKRFPFWRTLWLVTLVPLPFMFFRHYPHYWVQVLPFVAVVAAIAVTQFRPRLVSVGVLLFCFAIAGGKIYQDAEPNMQKLNAQLATAAVLKEDSRLRGSDMSEKLLAENQFTAFYFLLPQRPLNKYLYLTEITAAESAEEKTIADLKKETDVLILWPTHDRVYAKKLEAAINADGGDELLFEDLELRTKLWGATSR